MKRATDGRPVGRVERPVGPVDSLMAKIFGGPREPRSDAYKAGVRAVLRKHFEGVLVRDQLHYPVGSAERDAFFAGADEGHNKVRDLPPRVKTKAGKRAFGAEPVGATQASAGGFTC